MPDILKMGIKLLLITSIAALALGFTNLVTEEPIRLQIENANTEARMAVLPQSESFEPIDISSVEDKYPQIIEVYAGKANGNTIGYTFKIASKGFGGNVEVIVGINTDGQIEAVQIGNHQETPGLGAKASEPKFREQYNKKNTNPPLLVVKTPPVKDNEIEAITGATITSRAVTDGVNIAAQYYNNELKSGGSNQ